eukprot:gene11613-34320_t
MNTLKLDRGCTVIPRASRRAVSFPRRYFQQNSRPFISFRDAAPELSHHVASAQDRGSYTSSSSSRSTNGFQHNGDSSLDDSRVFTRFYWPKHLGGKDISTWGSFNNWSKGIKLHRFSDEFDASVIIPLPPGNYEFKFVVDNLWTTAPHEPTVTGAEKSLNNLKLVAPTISFSFKAPEAQQVLVVGDWDDYQYSILLNKDPESGVFFGQPGQYSYYYVVDQVVTLNPEEPVYIGSNREEVHKEWSYEPDLFRIFYCTGWENTVMHYKRCYPNGKKLPQVSMGTAAVRSARPVMSAKWRRLSRLNNRVQAGQKSASHTTYR